MKKNIIALAVAATFAAPMVAQAAPTLYGKLNLNINKTTDKGISVNSTASRMGVKGSNKLGNGLKAVYKIEFGLGQVADGDAKSPLSARNQFLGLAGSFGTVLMGRHDTPLKMSQPSDLFNDGEADVNPMAGGLGVFGKGGEVRAGEVIAYVSPAMGGVTFVLAGVSNAGGAYGSHVDDSPLNTISAAAMYGSKKKGLYLAAAMNNFSDDVAGGATEMRLSAQYKAAGLIVNGMYQSFSGDAIAETDGKEGTNIQLQAAYKMGKLMPKIKYSMINKDVGEDGNAFSVGLNYSLAKKTTAYVYYVSHDENVGDKKSAIAGVVHSF